MSDACDWIEKEIRGIGEVREERTPVRGKKYNGCIHSMRLEQFHFVAKLESEARDDALVRTYVAGQLTAYS